MAAPPERRRGRRYAPAQMPPYVASDSLGPGSSAIDSELCDPCKTIFQAIDRYPRWPSTRVDPLSSNIIATFPVRNQPQSDDSPAIRTKFHNIQALLCSASEGCHLCELLMEVMSEDDVTRLLDEIAEDPAVAWEQMKVLIWRVDTSLVIRIEEANLRPGYATELMLAELKYIEAATLTKHQALFTSPNISTASFETFNKIHYWLWECGNSHPSCFRYRQIQRNHLPTRLLYVGKFKSESIVRLQESSQISSTTLDKRYITLSHCWGATASIKLTRNRYDEFLISLTLEDLPQTFRDAITLTRYLGVDYIWIDSLCIIQDSMEDWKSESYQMAAIYNGSFLNIGANAYSNSDGGLFHARSSHSIIPLKMNLRWPPGHNTFKTLAFFPAGNASEDIERGPLGKRGWVAQERLLAPRTLFFQRNKVIWECPDLTTHEGDLMGLFKMDKVLGPGEWAQPPDERLSIDEQNEACIHKWNRAIRLYSQGDLTFQSDKLVAVAGLASYILPLWRDPSIRYLAGLWSYKFELALLWCTSDKNARRQADRRAPTWSWASIKGEVILMNPKHHGKSRFLVEVIQVDTYPIDNLLGPVNGGYVEIRAPLCPLIMTKFGDEREPEAVFSGGKKAAFCNIVFDEGDLTLNQVNASEPCYLLGIWHCKAERSLMHCKAEQSLMHGIIVRSTGASHGQHIRVGSWSASYTETTREKDRVWGRALGIPSPPAYEKPPNDIATIQDDFSAMLLPEEAYVTKDESGHVYTITII